MIEFKDTNTFSVGEQKFYPMMLPKGNLLKMQHVISFKNALMTKGLDPKDGTLFYCEKGDKYGMVFLPGEKE